MNILIVHPCKGFYGGAEEVVHQLTRYLIREGHVVQVVTKNAPKDLLWARRTIYDDMPTWRAFRSRARSYESWLDTTVCFNFPATLAVMGTKKPAVWYCNEPPELFSTWWRKPIEAYHRKWVRESGVTAAVADRFNAQRFYDLYRVEPRIIPYGVDYNFWQQEPYFIGNLSKVRLLQVGTVTPYKNVFASINALHHLLLNEIDATLTVAGKTDADKTYTDEIIEYLECNTYLRERTDFTGQVVPEKIKELYHSHDILLHPVDGQGGWLVPFEATCSGMPVIATTKFAGADYLRRAGQVVCLPEEFDKCVHNLLEHPTAVNTYKSAEWVKENLTWDKFGDSILQILKDVV